jgi:hypothetical protein
MGAKLDSVPSECDIDPNNSGRCRARDADRLIAGLAERQHGVVSRAQLLQAGVGRHLIDYRVVAGRLHVVHHGIYSVGHGALAIDARWMAAVLAAGPGAVLSHRAAAAVWQLRPFEHLEVTVPTERRRPSIRVRRSHLPPDETTTVRAIPVTTIPRTLLDLAAVLHPHQLERAVNEAEVRGLRDRLSLVDMVERYPTRPGIRTIKAIVELLERGTILTRSELESRFLAFIRRTGLPAPVLNAQLFGFECDCLWPEQRVIAELDGHATHGTRAAFERDRVRDRTLSANGWRTVRITWRQLQWEPDALATDLTRILAS